MAMVVTSPSSLLRPFLCLLHNTRTRPAISLSFSPPSLSSSPSFASLSSSPFSLSSSPASFSSSLSSSPSPLSSSFSSSLPCCLSSSSSLRMMCSSSAARSMEQQFEEFRCELDESTAVRDKLRSIVADLDTTNRLMHAQLLTVHHSCPTPGILDKAKAHVDSLCLIYGQLAEVIKACPGQYYRYHDHWRNQTYTVVFLLAFLHWLETGELLSHKEAEALLHLNQEEFGIDLDDYLVGICNLSNELPRYVVNQVTAGDYDCPKRVSVFLSDLYAAFRILNLRNDVVRKRFDGMKYDLKKVEEVLYDVKIRGLMSSSDHGAPISKSAEAMET